jgi:hypothetical protein
MRGHINLILKYLNILELSTQLWAVHSAQLNLRGLKTVYSTYTWFQVKNRLARPSNTLGPYKFAHNTDVSEFNFNQLVVLKLISSGLKET